MRKVILVYPRTGFDVIGGSVDLPMSVLCAATLVAQEFETVIIDQRVELDWTERLLAELTQDPICVGISCMTGPQIRYALDITRLVKLNSCVPVVWGGVHATLLPYQTLQHPMIDYVVVGEGEKAFLKLVRSLNRKQPTLSVLKFKSYVNLETLPAPPYHLVSMCNYVGDQGRLRDRSLRSLIFFGSRGCPYSCQYCCNEALHHRSWRIMPADEMYRRSHELVARYTLDAIMYHDEDLFIDPKRVTRLAELINGSWLWYAQVRADSTMDVDLPTLYAGGLRTLQVGIESGSPRVLKLIHKGETRETMIAANRALALTPIMPLYNFIMGFPTETYDELMESVDLAIRLLDENPNAEMTGFYVYVPYPGTEMYQLACKHGFIAPHGLDEWANFTRQSFTAPWQQERADLYRTVLTMSKFLDSTRMLRRLQDNGEVGRVQLWALRLLTKLYRKRLRAHDFNRELEMRLTGWISDHLFTW